mgnify:CR=1 FL=1
MPLPVFLRDSQDRPPPSAVTPEQDLGSAAPAPKSPRPPGVPQAGKRRVSSAQGDIRKKKPSPSRRMEKAFLQ